jgi:hypothetical protein
VPSVICTRNRTLRVGWRLTAEFSGRGLTCQHAGARRPPERRAPAAEHFMVHGPLQRFVRRPSLVFKMKFLFLTIGR